MGEEKKNQFLAFYFNTMADQPFKLIKRGTETSKSINDIRNVVFPGQTVLSVVGEGFSDPKMIERQDYVGITAGNFIEDGGGKLFISKIYGYAVIRGRTLSVEPLIEVSKDKNTAFMYYFSNHDGVYPDLEGIRKTIALMNYKGYLGDEKISMQVDKIKESGKRFGILTVCKGHVPKNGQIEHYILLKDIESKVGTIVEGDRIDFKEKNTFTPVQKGESVLEKKPFIAPEHGFDVTGVVVKGKLLGDKRFMPGENLEFSKDHPHLMIATTNGVLSYNNKKISVDNRVVINSDIDLATGNIKIEGTLEIFGNVRSGMEVRATGDILIHGNVEDSAILAEGNIFIDNGVLGKEKAYLEAGSNITLRFAQNTKMKAGNDIHVRESLIQCSVYAKNMVNVAGTVVGGDIIGRNGLSVKVAGSDKGVETKLGVGRDPELEQAIKSAEEERKQLELLYSDNMEEMKMQFGTQFLVDLKGYLGVLRGTRKVKFIEMLTNLNNTTKEVNKKKEQLQGLREKLSFLKLPVIQIQEKVYADVVLQIRRTITKIKKEQLGATFREDLETGMIIE